MKINNMKSKKMIALELEKEISNIKINISLKQAVKIVCSLFKNICSVSIHDHSLTKTEFSFPGLFEVSIINDEINLIDLIKSISENSKRLGKIEGEDKKANDIKDKVISLLYSININNL